MKNPEFNQDFQEWLEALENTILTDGEDYTSELLQKLFQEAKIKGIELGDIFNPSFKNTVSADDEVPYPGNLEIEEKITAMIEESNLRIKEQEKKSRGEIEKATLETIKSISAKFIDKMPSDNDIVKKLN